MPRLIVINGPPGIGKSTIAQRYVDDHPGVLNLDIDRIAGLVGGFRDDFSAAVSMARTLALDMARSHLRRGHDVIVPQFIGRVSELERFELVGEDAGCAVCHVVLMDTLERSLSRFALRRTTARDEERASLHAYVELGGGDTMLTRMYEALADVVRARLTSVLVTGVEGEIEQTYQLVASALAAPQVTTPPRGVAVVIDAGRVLVILRRRKGLEYAVLPGGGVENGETVAEAALRELLEETSLTAHVEAELWRRHDDGRSATYLLMSDVTGTPLLSGSEAEEHNPDNSFVLAWVTADELDRIRLQPAQIRAPLAALL